MTQPKTDNLLARLAGLDDTATETNPWADMEARRPDHDASDERLEAMLDRIADLAEGKVPEPEPEPECAEEAYQGFVPIEPESFVEAKLTESEVEELILKYLLSRGSGTGRECADQVKITFKLVEGLLTRLKSEQLVVYRDTAPMNDYHYQLTDMGRERARRYVEHCTYFGSSPVSLEDYIASVAAQSLTNQHPTAKDLETAFADLLISPLMMRRLGPAINSGRGMFLYGPPGNGKTSIAERVTKSFGQHIWVPRAIGVDGEIIRLYDPSNHRETPPPPPGGLLDNRRVDKRWIRIRRPTIVAGGELTMDALEVMMDTSTGISEAPLQLKSNCGTLVIDDFGRQKMSTDQLLNRWIVPLERRFDFLSLPNGKKIEVPFDQLIVFSTNLEPRDLVDDAFLRRIPYKISINDPSEAEFRELFRLMAAKLGIEYREEMIDYLIETHYKPHSRPFRCCHPRDLLLQIVSFCRFQRLELEMSREYFDFAVENYFAIM